MHLVCIEVMMVKLAKIHRSMFCVESSLTKKEGENLSAKKGNDIAAEMTKGWGSRVSAAAAASLIDRAAKLSIVVFELRSDWRLTQLSGSRSAGW